MHRFALLFLLTTGCISKAQYSSLESQYSSAQQENSDLKARNAELKKRLDRLETAAAARLQALDELRRDFQPLVDQGLLEITVDDGRVVIGMKSDVLFPSGSATLSSDGKAALQQVAQKLSTREDRFFQVEGHTDSDAISTAAFPDNWHLGAVRAVTVLNYLVESGMAREQLSAASFADTRPVSEDKSLNRRIELVLLPDFSDLPGYEALMQQAPESRRHSVKKRPRRR